MRSFVVLATAAICIVAASAETTHTADKHFLETQKKIFDLFWHPYQATVVKPELQKLANTWDFKANFDKYTDKFAVQNFLQRFEHGMLPRGEIFSSNYPVHLDEVNALYRLFYAAKDFDTFYNTAVWARFHVNEMQFTYALIVAVLHRPDLEHIRIPNLYELIPYMFYNDEVIRKAEYIKIESFLGNYHLGKKETVSGIDNYVIQANYSNWYIHNKHDEEWKINYFTEDIGWNSFYFLARHEFAPWMSTAEFNLNKFNRGEFYYFLHKQLYNRYNLERLSNDMGEVEYFDWNKPFVTGYYPTMSFFNGLPFPKRESFSEIPAYKWKYIDEVEEYEARINFAIDSGYIFDKNGKFVDIYTPEGLDLLGNVIEGNADSYNKKFYGSVSTLASKILGFNVEPSSTYHIVPSALEFYSTNLRDPAFYRIYKRILNFFYKYKSNLPVYTHDELIMPGVTIQSFTVDKLVTYFDYFDASVNNALVVESEKDASSYVVRVRQERLNHKPYTFTLNINSDKEVKGVIRIFLGPKFNKYHQELDITENYMNFVELDQWIVDLKTGENKIERKSYESIYTVPDALRGEEYYKKITETLAGGEVFTFPEQLYGIPDRLTLPKGKVEGMPFQLFAYISLVDDAHLFKYDSPILGKNVFDKKPMGFPLDRPMYGFNFTVPNMVFKDVLIYHEQLHDVKVTV